MILTLKFIEEYTLSLFINVPHVLENKYAPGIGAMFYTCPLH